MFAGEAISLHVDWYKSQAAEAYHIEASCHLRTLKRAESDHQADKAKAEHIQVTALCMQVGLTIALRKEVCCDLWCAGGLTEQFGAWARRQ